MISFLMKATNHERFSLTRLFFGASQRTVQSSPVTFPLGWVEHSQFSSRHPMMDRPADANVGHQP